jgi:L-erythro-3,5-diaminohexanoate dehydrogenase
MSNPCPFGTHRVIRPAGAMPQLAWQLDAVSPCWNNELELSVDLIHVDAASFRQIRQAENDNLQRIIQHVEGIVRERGKLHNPVTGSGGMLIGTAKAYGTCYRNPPALGQRIASLVSLTLTPLHLDTIERVDLAHARLRVQGRAILFSSSPWAHVAPDLPETAVLAALDVAGAAPRTRLRTRPGDRVLILGSGRSGLLAALAARRAGAAEVAVVDIDAIALRTAKEVGAATRVIEGTVLDPFALRRALGEPADLTVSTVDVAGAEAAAILCTQPRGTVLFFSMATSFQSAALFAEGIGSAVTLEIGNGCVEGHAQETLDLLRTYPALSARLM